MKFIESDFGELINVANIRKFGRSTGYKECVYTHYTYINDDEESEREPTLWRHGNQEESDRAFKNLKSFLNDSPNQPSH